jgi:hypothetical protein
MQLVIAATNPNALTTKMPKHMLSPNAPAAKKYFSKFQYDWKFITVSERK